MSTQPPGHPRPHDPLLQAQLGGYGHTDSERGRSKSASASADGAAKKAHFELDRDHDSSARPLLQEPDLQHSRPVHLHPPAASAHHSHHPSQQQRQPLLTDTGALASPPLLPIPQSPGLGPGLVSPSFTQRLRFALAHKPTLSRTWEKRSYAEQLLNLDGGLSLDAHPPHGVHGAGGEGQMELSVTRAGARSRPTSLYASPVDVAAYRPLPMVEGGMTYPYSAPVTPAPPAPPSHV